MSVIGEKNCPFNKGDDCTDECELYNLTYKTCAIDTMSMWLANIHARLENFEIALIEAGRQLLAARSYKDKIRYPGAEEDEKPKRSEK